MAQKGRERRECHPKGTKNRGQERKRTNNYIWPMGHIGYCGKARTPQPIGDERNGYERYVRGKDDAMPINYDRVRLTPYAMGILREIRIQLDDSWGPDLWRASARKRCTASQAIVWLDLVRREGDLAGTRIWADMIRRGEI